MRANLRWALSATLALSAWAILWPKPSPQVVGAVVSDAPAVRPAVALVDGRQQGSTSVALPGELSPWSIEPAKRDPFVPERPAVQVPYPPPAAKVTPAPAATSTLPPSPPPAPPLNVRYLGSMMTPGGQQVIMLARGDQAIQVQVGTRLEEGHTVRAIDGDKVQLIHQPTGTVINVPIPEQRGTVR